MKTFLNDLAGIRLAEGLDGFLEVFEELAGKFSWQCR
jgi:hypothetical protein